MDSQRPQGSQEKATITMFTNISGRQKKRQLRIFKHIPLHKYIELYEQVFDIDLYAYRCSFRCGRQVIEKLADIHPKCYEDTPERKAERKVEVELFVEHAGG